MLNFFPTLYPDEMLMSVINRYKRKCGMVSKRALERDLFNQIIGQKSVLFPQNTSTLISKLPPRSKVTSQEIIINHTAFPYFTAFLSGERSNEIYRSMEDSNSINIENMTGIAGSKVKLYNRLRYCPICFSEDMEKYGESYWRRIHQMPGVLYCQKHRVLIKESNVVISDSKNDYLCADEDTCTPEIVEDFYPKIYKELNLKYVNNVEKLLLGKHQKKELKFIIDFYIDKLRERRYTSERGYLYIDKLIDGFLQHYPKEYLELMQSEVDKNQMGNWLRIFVRYNSSNRSPLRHLLFLQFLQVEVEEIFNEKKVIGRISAKEMRSPIFDKEKRRKEWLRIIESNPGANRSELKEIGKHIHTWIYTHDREWYHKVTPRNNSRKKKVDIIDWAKRDEECLALARKGYERVLTKKGKPVRICPESIRREIGAKRWFYNKRLVKTQKYLKEVNESIESFRIRKIRWAIEDRIQQGEPLTKYKVQLHAGFGNANKEIKELIAKILREYK